MPIDRSPDPPRVSVLGFPIAAQSFDAAVDLLLGWARERPCRAVHFCTVHLLVEGRDRPEVGAALASGSMLTADGMPLVWLSRAAGSRAQRVAGPDAMPAILERGRELGLRHFFYGSTPETLERLVAAVRRDHPGIVIAGAYAPPFGDQDAAAVEADIARINAARPDVLWVGLGAPRQNLWIDRNRHRLDVGIALAVGAAFDFRAGTVSRAPRLLQRSGLEWLYRLAREPRRLMRRYVVTNARFLYYLARERRPRRGIA